MTPANPPRGGIGTKIGPGVLCEVMFSTITENVGKTVMVTEFAGMEWFEGLGRTAAWWCFAPDLMLAYTAITNQPVLVTTGILPQVALRPIDNTTQPKEPTT